MAFPSLRHLWASALLSLPSSLSAQSFATPSPWGDWVEKDFPHFSSVLDARDLPGFPKDNLTPRGLILNLGNNLWACFDTDLLRIAAIWEAEAGKPPVTPEALAPGSYHLAGQKTKDGQDFLPKPNGKVWLANGIYPGWQVGNNPSLADPREPAPSPDEVGKGPLDPKVGQFFRFERVPSGVALVYRVHGVEIRDEYGSVKGKTFPHRRLVTRTLTVGPRTTPLVNLISYDGGASERHIAAMSAEKREEYYRQIGMLDEDGITNGSLASRTSSFFVEPQFLTIKPGGSPEVVKMEFSDVHRWAFVRSSRAKVSDAEQYQFSDSADSQSVTTSAKLATTQGPSYSLDTIPLPVPNPWKRNVRLADIDFLDDQGNAVGVTFDGDVWKITGLSGDLTQVTWKRFASGLHEPMSIVSRGKDIFVFDRNGVWNLVDTDGNGEADRYEMFCNVFAQTAETREFPNSMKLGPDGSLYISKGGQEGTTIGKHNGTVIRISPDGKSIAVIGYGLRQPFIGVNPKTGLVTASDQQGNYVPSTPIHIIGDHHFYGHLPTIAPPEQYPESIADPLVWIPHPVNPSGVTQVWMTDAKMGPINDEMLHIGYNRPEIFRVLMNARFKKPQATVMSFWRDLDFGPLNGHINPADGQLYIVGFQIWGTTAKALSGLARLRYTGEPRVLLKECTPMDQGLLLRFNTALDPKLAQDPASYSAERWNYKRTPEYGSPHLKLDGSPGQEWLVPSSAYLSKDGLSVFVGIPDMKPGVNQMRIGWGLKSVEGAKAENTAYFTPFELATFDPVKEGFGEMKVDLTPREAAAVAQGKASAEEGQRLYQMIGCMACHSTDGSTVGKVGPSWKGIFGSEREIGKVDGKNVKKVLKVQADEVYLHESIINPNAKVVKGFEKFDTGMPIYNGILNESQIQSLILFIKSLH